ERVLHYSRNVVEHVAIVVGRGIGNVEDIQTGELLGRRGLLWVDRGRRLSYVYDFFDFLEMGERHVQAGDLANLNRLPRDNVETRLFYAELPEAGSQVAKIAVTCEVGLAPERRCLGRRLKVHTGVRNEDT